MPVAFFAASYMFLIGAVGLGFAFRRVRKEGRLRGPTCTQAVGGCYMMLGSLLGPAVSKHLVSLDAAVWLIVISAMVVLGLAFYLIWRFRNDITPEESARVEAFREKMRLRLSEVQSKRKGRG